MSDQWVYYRFNINSCFFRSCGRMTQVQSLGSHYWTDTVLLPESVENLEHMGQFVRLSEDEVAAHILLGELPA